MTLRLCRCGHIKSKHKREYSGYPIDAPECDGENLPRYHLDHCRCQGYDPKQNLEYLEEQYLRLVDKNKKGRKV